tara:strand:+ start:374 stop:502 length:129 start_codon:yes stop_codon:yes gene_type:complete
MVVAELVLRLQLAQLVRQTLVVVVVALAVMQVLVQPQLAVLV